MKYTKCISTLFLLISSQALSLAQPPEAHQAGLVADSDLSDERIIRDLIVCAGPVWASLRPQDRVYPVDPFAQLYWKAYRELLTKWINVYRDESVRISADVSGVDFTGLLPMAVDGYIGTISYSPTSSPDTMRKMLVGLGAVMRSVSEVKMLDRNVSEWVAEKLSGDVIIRYRFIEGQPHFQEFKNKFASSESKGVTLVCSAREATAEQEQAQGIVGVKQAESTLAVNAPPPSQWFRKLLSHGTQTAKLAVAEHRYLEDEQVSQLLELQEAAVANALINNPGVVFSAAQIDFVIQSRLRSVIHALIRKYHARLTPEQRVTLSDNARWRSSLQLLSGGELAVAELQRLYNEGSRGDISRALGLIEISKFSQEKIPLIDVIIVQGTPEDRRLLVSYSGIMYTPEQIKILLQDTDPQVRNGLLRRRDLNIDADLVKKYLPQSD